MPLTKLLLIGCALLGSSITPPQQQEKKGAPTELHAPLFCYFIPPQGWEINDPRILSSRIQISFFKKKSEGFCPSINLAIESIDVSQTDYLKAVKQIQEKNRSNRWRKLGKIHTAAGVADLTEIDTTTDWGPVRMLQLILVKHSKAYVLTAAALKKEIPSLYKEFQTAFRSLQLTDDLLSAIPQSERRTSLKAAETHLLTAWKQMIESSLEPVDPLSESQFQKNHWLPFQESVIESYQDMGSYWQVLLLQHLQTQLQNQTHSASLELSSRQNNPDKDITKLE